MNEFEIAMDNFDLTDRDIELIVKDSIRHAFCDDRDKGRLMEQVAGYFAGLGPRVTQARG